MDLLFQTFPILLEIDRHTFLLIGLFVGWACYFIKGRLENAAWLVFLYPLFWIGSIAAYALLLNFEFFNPKLHREWVVYTVTAASVGCALGIALVGLLRRVQERLIDGKYQKQLEVRQRDDRESAEDHHRALSDDPMTRSA